MSLQVEYELRDHIRHVTLQRDKALMEVKRLIEESKLKQIHELRKADEVQRERDEAREEIERLRKNVVAANKGAERNSKINYSLAGQLIEARRERDDARDALAKINELLMCGEAGSVTGSVYEDWKALREIVKKALDEA